MKTSNDATFLNDDYLLTMSELMNGQHTLIRFITEKAIRNSLEDLHSGIFPSTKTNDYSDVKVVTPYGEIPWNNISRISDKELRTLMLEIEIRLHNTFSSLIPKLIMNNDYEDNLMTLIDKMYEKGVSWDVCKEEWDKHKEFQKDLTKTK
jgi:hypothetical protein